MLKPPPADTHHDDPTATPKAAVDCPGRARGRGRVVLLGVAIASVAIDVASKAWASSSLPGNPMSLGPLTLRLIHNHGVALGVGAYLPAGALVAITAAIGLVVAVAGWRGRLNPPVAAGLIVGGAVANVADRLTAGSVVDFIDIGRWPVFNLADVSLLVGIGLLASDSGTRSPAGASNTGDEINSKMLGR
jgi:signal peptidase II